MPKGAGGGATATFISRYVIPVLLTVKGTTLTHTGSITNVGAGEAVTSKPVTIQTTLKNTGNHHYNGVFVDVTVTDSGGNVVSTASTNPSLQSLMPENEMTLTAPLSAALAPGTYTVTSDVKVGTTLIDTKTISFTVAEPGATAPTQTVTEAPTQAATEVLTQAVSEVPTAPMTVVTTEEAPVTPETIATRAPLSAVAVMLAFAAVSGILALRRRN
jgi:methionine-rich copper-binding protein CopC